MNYCLLTDELLFGNINYCLVTDELLFGNGLIIL